MSAGRQSILMVVMRRSSENKDTAIAPGPRFSGTCSGEQHLPAAAEAGPLPRQRRTRLHTVLRTEPILRCYGRFVSFKRIGWAHREPFCDTNWRPLLRLCTVVASTCLGFFNLLLVEREKKAHLQWTQRPDMTKLRWTFTTFRGRGVKQG